MCRAKKFLSWHFAKLFISFHQWDKMWRSISTLFVCGCGCFPATWAVSLQTLAIQNSRIPNHAVDCKAHALASLFAFFFLFLYCRQDKREIEDGRKPHHARWPEIRYSKQRHTKQIVVGNKTTQENKKENQNCCTRRQTDIEQQEKKNI